jgi:hypothetical protein
MRKLILALILTTITGSSFAHNMVYLDADSITSSTVLIRAVEVHSEFGVGGYFDLGSGSNLDIDINLAGDAGGCCNYITGGFNSNSNSSLTIKMDGGATGHRVELDYDYTGLSNYHHVDIDFKDYYYQKLYFDDGDVDHSNTSFELDMYGGSTNTVYATIAGTQQAVKIDVNGGGNTIYAWVSGIGDLATGRTEIWDSNDPATYAIWMSITGSNNTVRAKSVGTSKTKITLSGTGNHTISEYNDHDDWLLNQDGGVIDLTIGGTSNNRIGYSGSGSGNTATITLNGNGQTSLTVDLEQTGGNNRFELEVTGTTIHTYQPKFTQDGDDSYCATVNLNNLSASNSTTTTNASGGC